jgi:hypothetical protein
MAKGNLGALLAKMIVQYGPIFCLDASLPLDYIQDYFLYIVHPFAYRTVQQAPTRVKRYMIQKTDVEDMIIESEEIECQADIPFKRDCLHRIPARTLTNENPVLAKKIALARAFV